MTALHQFGAEMLKLSRGLESFAPMNEPTNVDVAAGLKAKDDISSINNFESSSSDFQSNMTKRYVCKIIFCLIRVNPHNVFNIATTL